MVLLFAAFENAVAFCAGADGAFAFTKYIYVTGKVQ
jgi:hypothetical protein